MENIISTVDFIENKQWISSSSFTKTAILCFNGGSASIFRKSTDYSVNP